MFGIKKKVNLIISIKVVVFFFSYIITIVPIKASSTFSRDLITKIMKIKAIKE